MNSIPEIPKPLRDYAVLVAKWVVIVAIAVVVARLGLEDSVQVTIPDFPQPPLEIVFPTAVPTTTVTYGYQTDNYSTDGGDTWVVGGDLNAVSGGEIDVASGATLDVNGTADYTGATVTNLSMSGGTINGNLVVTGTSDLQGTVSDSGGDLTIGDNVAVTGTATFSKGSGDAAVVSAGGVLSLPATADISAYGYVAVGDGTPDGSVSAGTDEQLYVEGALEVDGELEADGSVDADGDLDVDGTANLDDADIDGAMNLAVYQEHIGVMSVMTRAITYTAGAGGSATLLSMDASTIYFVYSVFIETTTEWTVTAGDDETLTIGDGNDTDGFLAATHTQMIDSFTEATGYAAGWYGLENGSGGDYTLDDGGPFVYDNSGSETVDIAWGATGDDLTAGAATAYIVYMRIQ